MRKLMNKKLNKKGFTLMEMLIVVAIIAILVAIAIPTFTSALNKARASADAANIRSGYATLQAGAMLEDYADGTYYLKKDGSVSNANTKADSYICQAGSANLTENNSIGGKTATWTKGQAVSYTLADGKITTIAGATAPTT